MLLGHGRMTQAAELLFTLKGQFLESSLLYPLNR